jgi:hypothetical protein
MHFGALVVCMGAYFALGISIGQGQPTQRQLNKGSKRAPPQPPKVKLVAINHPHLLGYSIQPFDVDATEVTNDLYRRCMAAGVCGEPLVSIPAARSLPGFRTIEEDAADLPVQWVTRDNAEKLCKWRKARLPTFWEYRVLFGMLSVSKDATPRICLNAQERCPVGSSPADRTPNGVFDIFGNVIEWIAPVTQKSLAFGLPFTKDGSDFFNGTPPFGEAIKESGLGIGFRCARSRGPDPNLKQNEYYARFEIDSFSGGSSLVINRPTAACAPDSNSKVCVLAKAAGLDLTEPTRAIDVHAGDILYNSSFCPDLARTPGSGCKMELNAGKSRAAILARMDTVKDALAAFFKEKGIAVAYAANASGAIVVSTSMLVSTELAAHGFLPPGRPGESYYYQTVVEAPACAKAEDKWGCRVYISSSRIGIDNMDRTKRVVTWDTAAQATEKIAYDGFERALKECGRACLQTLVWTGKPK